MIGFRFTEFIPDADKRTPFERLLPLFLELLNYTSGDAKDTLDWMEEIDKQQPIFSDNYNRDDFEQELMLYLPADMIYEYYKDCSSILVPISLIEKYSKNEV